MVMRLKNLKKSWKSLKTAEKINLVLDFICGMGAGVLVYDVNQKLAPGHNKLEKVLLNITTMGLGVAAGVTSSNALMEAYGNNLATAINRISGKTEEDEDENKEDDENA